MEDTGYFLEEGSVCYMCQEGKFELHEEEFAAWLECPVCGEVVGMD